MEDDSTCIVQNVGRMAGSDFMRLREECCTIIDVANVTVIQQPNNVQKNIKLHIDLLQLFLRCLEKLSMVFDHVCLSVAETQRVTRLLQALTDYITVYKPMLDRAITQHEESSNAYSHLMGAFASDTTTLQHFF